MRMRYGGVLTALAVAMLAIGAVGPSEGRSAEVVKVDSTSAVKTEVVSVIAPLPAFEVSLRDTGSAVALSLKSVETFDQRAMSRGRGHVDTSAALVERMRGDLPAPALLPVAAPNWRFNRARPQNPSRSRYRPPSFALIGTFSFADSLRLQV